MTSHLVDLSPDDVKSVAYPRAVMFLKGIINATCPISALMILSRNVEV